MAKKAKTSARSKGYRKVEQKKPFLSKKELIWLAAIVAAIVLAVVLFNVFYDDGSLKTSGGKVIAENLENSIVINAGKGDAPKYFKVGEVGQIEGYTRERAENSTDANIATFKFLPAAGDGQLDYISVSGGKGTPQALAANVMYSMAQSGFETTQIQETEIGGRKVYYLTYILQGTDETTKVTTVSQSFVAYTPSSFEKYAISIGQTATAESEPNLDEAGIAAFKASVVVPDDVLLANLETALGAISTDSQD